MSLPDPHYADAKNTLYVGNCLDVLAGMDESSVDSVVTDPPYELEFMGQAWDGSGVAFREDTWRQVLRVLRPGGHLLAFGGSRTYHRLACAVEDAGFEVRDQLQWLYGSGFPKSLDVSKAIDSAAGSEREVVGSLRTNVGMQGGNYAAAAETGSVDVTAPATPQAQRWDGWGTALKPAHEPIVLARKPLAGTVAGNVTQHGTGALNVDGCRLGMSEADRENFRRASEAWHDMAQRRGEGKKPADVYGTYGIPDPQDPHPGGRWPANVVLGCACDQPHERGCAATILDQQSGYAPPSTRTARNDYAAGMYGPERRAGDEWGYNDSGGASRFFYCAKASRAERDAANSHPTVKPVELMRWLVRLVTPPDGLVLDPFAGSGTTGIAATVENKRCVMVERDPDYADIAVRRLSKPLEPTLELGGAA